MNDHLTGYLLATGVVAALAEREGRGGFWRVDASLTRTSVVGNELAESVDAEPDAPVTEQSVEVGAGVRIRNFVPNFGIEDRGDGRGVVGLVSKPEALEAQLKRYAAAHI
jgi:hypothetical protein